MTPNKNLPWIQKKAKNKQTKNDNEGKIQLIKNNPRRDHGISRKTNKTEISVIYMFKKLEKILRVKSRNKEDIERPKPSTQRLKLQCLRWQMHGWDRKQISRETWRHSDRKLKMKQRGREKKPQFQWSLGKIYGFSTHVIRIL